MSQTPHRPDLPTSDPAPWAPPAGRDRRFTGLTLVVVLLIIALAAVGTVAVVQTARLQDQRAEVVSLQQQEAEDAATIERLRETLEERPTPAETDPLEDLLGGGGLEDLLGGGGLEDLLGEGGLEDLLGEGGLEDLLGEGGLEDLLGEGGLAATPDVAACTDDAEDMPDIDEDTLEGQFAAATEAVEQLRGQAFPAPIDPEIMTGEEIRAFFQAEIAEAYPAEQADAERRILGMLQAVPDDIDLVATQTDLLGDQVAGFYDDETRQLVVRADDPDAVLTGTGLITLAHELEHALVDATVGLPDLDGFDTDDDGAIAALSVIEGSAVGLQSQFQVSALNPLAILGDLGSLLDGQQGLDSVPSLIRQSLLFPYVAGPTYICSLYAGGGWDAVDEALRTPPATSHEILFPGEDVEVAPVTQLEGPEGLDLVQRRTFGAAQLSFLFAAPGDDESVALPDPIEAARAWRGGEISLWIQDEASAVGLALTGEGLCQPLTAWWQAAAVGPSETARGDEQVVRGTAEGTWGVVTCDGEDVRFAVAASLATARQTIG